MKEYTTNDYVKYRLQKSKDTLKEAELLLNHEYWNAGSNRLYYACFYAVGALLVKNHIKTSSHSGCRQQFGLHFIKSGIVPKELGIHFTELFTKRHKGDYDDFFDYDKDTAFRLLTPSKELISIIEKLLKE